MKKFIECLILTANFVLFGSVNVLASENLSVNVKPENNNIHVSWNKLGHLYKLYKIEGDTEESLYEGNDNKFAVTGLEEGKFYKFKLLAIKDDKEFDKVIINTATTDRTGEKNHIQPFSSTTKINEETSEIYYPMKDAQINAFVGDDKITIEWNNLPNDFKYFEVYKNDILTKRTQKNSVY